MKKIFLVLVCALFTLSACWNNQVSNTSYNQFDTEGYTKFTSSGLLSIEYPETWVLEEDFMWTIFVIQSPLEVDDTFSENINFLTQNIWDMGATDIEEYIDINLSQIEIYLSDFQLLSKEDTNISGIDGQKLSYTFKQWQLDIFTEQHFIAVNDIAYIFTVTRPQDNPNAFNEEFENILNSIEIL